MMGVGLLGVVGHFVLSLKKTLMAANRPKEPWEV